MDTFVEQIVAKKKGPKEIAIIAGTIFLTVVLVFLLFIFLGYFSLVIDMLLIYGAWWLVTSQNIEYEYSVTNGDIDIDQIIAQRKRKRVVSVAGSKIETAGPYNPAEFAGRRFDRTVMAAPSEVEPGVWYFTYRSKKSGSTLVIFQPEERVMEAFKAALPKLLMLDVDRKLAQQ